MKKYLSTSILAALVAVGLVACGGDDASETSAAPTESTAPDAPAESTAPTDAPMVTEAPDAPVATEAPDAPVATEAPAQAAETTTTAAAPVETGPTFGNVTVDCLNRGLRVNAEVNKGSSDISRVVVKRANDENAELETRLSFLGPDTGAGNVWNGVNIAGTVDRITIVATDAAGRTASTQKSFNLPC
jgi:hypothetical protein